MKEEKGRKGERESKEERGLWQTKELKLPPRNNFTVHSALLILYSLNFWLLYLLTFFHIISFNANDLSFIENVPTVSLSLACCYVHDFQQKP